ncbi:MAG: hypothetical protein H6R47_1279 [Proteobacteria bacterium]|nr:hypothetical protein [Pseudomonadota bacterium]
MNSAFRILLSIFTIMLIAPTGVLADNSQASDDDTAALVFDQPLTLVELTDLALRRNAKTRLAWAAIRSSEAGVELARAGYWPQIDATVSAQRNRALNFSGLPSDIQSRYGASVSLSICCGISVRAAARWIKPSTSWSPRR